MRKVAGLDADSATPAELMRALLKADIDLLWFGGIGTYVKAASQGNADAGDRANDAIRVNGADIRAKVIGEGANLGCTQLGRVEYASAGRTHQHRRDRQTPPASTPPTTRSISRSCSAARCAAAS